MAKSKDVTAVNSDEQSDSQDKPRNPWTNAFIRVAKYLVRDYGDKVRVDPEFPLFQEPMRIDAVIIKQEAGLVIDNAVMRFFKKHNIVEFKSPKDTLNIEAFDKTMSYYYAYLSNERNSEKPPIKVSDVTITIVSARRPVKALKILREERNYKIVNTQTPGIYYITLGDRIPEAIQLVISSELPDDGKDQSLLWLRSLRDNLTAEEAVKLVKIAEKKSSDDSIRSIVYFILDANPHTEKEVKMLIAPVSPKTKKWVSEWADEFGLFEENAKKTAKKLKANGVDVKTIAKSLGLSADCVKRL